jgi:hypothetical protein
MIQLQPQTRTDRWSSRRASVSTVERGPIVMPRTVARLILTAVVVAAAAPAAAQRIELTPFAGYQFGGDLAEVGDETIEIELDDSSIWGVVFNIDITNVDQLELYYSSQSTGLVEGSPSSQDVGIETLHVGAIRQYGRNQAVSPYLGLLLGATRFDISGDSDTRFSGAISAGAKMIVADHLGFRFDGRVTGIATGSDPISCTGDRCLGYPDTSIIWQWSINAGVIIHFGP